MPIRHRPAQKGRPIAGAGDDTAIAIDHCKNHRLFRIVRIFQRPDQPGRAGDKTCHLAAIGAGRITGCHDDPVLGAPVAAQSRCQIGKSYPATRRDIGNGGNHLWPIAAAGDLPLGPARINMIERKLPAGKADGKAPCDQPPLFLRLLQRRDPAQKPRGRGQLPLDRARDNPRSFKHLSRGGRAIRLGGAPQIDTDDGKGRPQNQHHDGNEADAQRWASDPIRHAYSLRQRGRPAHADSLSRVH